MTANSNRSRGGEALGAGGLTLSFALLTVAFAAMSYAAISWTSFGGATAIWPTNALALVAILRGPRGWVWRIVVLTALAVAMVAMMLYAGGNLVGALLVAAPNLLEVLVAVLLLSAFKLVGTDVTRPGPLLAFLACAAVAAPAAAALAAAPVIAYATQSSLIEAAWISWVTDALSMMILVPFGVVMTRDRLAVWRSKIDALIAISLFVAISVAVWLLVPLEPALIALTAPLAVLATLRFGAVGAATAVLWTGLLAIGLHLAGLGSVSAGDAGLQAKLFHLQLGLATLPLTTLPIAAVLSKLDRALQAAATAERARNAFESAGDAMITLNPSGSIETVNAAAESLFGYSADELDRRDVSLLLDLAHDGDGVFMSRLGASRRALAGGVVRELTGRRRNGESFPADVGLGVMNLPTGPHVVAVVRDISARRRVEELKEEFVSTVSHELRTPLTSIAGSLGLLAGGAAGPLPEKAARLVGIAHANSQRLVRLINDILDIEKIESGKLTLDLSIVDLGEIAGRSVEAMRGLADDLGVGITLTPAEPAPVRADPDRLMQVVTNLLSNACKFSPAGGTVTVSVDSRARMARLSVRDQGPGIPEAFRSRIFSKFAQADGSGTRAKGGTGLGLAIAREITERHGGRLWFESPPGEGATFHLELPLSSADPTVPQDGPRLLICEDDALAGEMLRQMLEYDGFAADVAGTGDQTLRAARTGWYAAVLVDLHLPDMDGVALIRALRDDDSTRHLPVVVVSGNVADGQERGGSLEVVDWLAKPFDQTRLRSAVNAILQRRSNRPLVLHVDDDRDTLEVTASALGEIADLITADNLSVARRMLRERRPDLIILDLGLPDGSGLELLPDVDAAYGSTVPVVVYSAQEMDADLANRVDAVLVKSRTSLAGLTRMVRDLTAKTGEPSQ
ncbi:ATP-binding protein [Brevundimonas sp. LjRoot202]|uniref:ATP-binding protein n=1 Tax=Brevundimonas sp. LjRoot202 TaxID=3342281 RepID=UPI003ECC29CF